MSPSATAPADHSGSKTSLDFNIFWNVINGKLVGSDESRHGINPATKEPLGEVPIASEKDLDAAVHAARAAFKSWSKTAISKRRIALEAFATAFESYQDDFAKLMTSESGKPIQFSVEEVESGPYWIRELNRIDLPEEVIDESDRKVITRYTPLGVVGAIVPWNYPIQLAFAKFAPALVTGNTVIVKPSPYAPYCTLKLVELAQRFLPPGVLQVLSGDDNLGPWLTAHPGIDKISFTGSVATGKKVMESASRTLKRVTLELGGNDAAIICEDVDIPTVARQIAKNAFLNTGQICVSIKRVYIHQSIYAEFRTALVEAVKSLQVGNGFQPGVFLGPIQNEAQYDRVCSFLRDIEKERQTTALESSVELTLPGYFVNATIIDNPADTARVVVEEPFGPILPILSWSTEDEVIHRANDSDMGLGASVWTDDLEQGERIGRQLEAGAVWVNSHMDIWPDVPFGGCKQSGIGIEGGMAGLKAFCNTQTLAFKKSPKK